MDKEHNDCGACSRIVSMKRSRRRLLSKGDKHPESLTHEDLDAPTIFLKTPEGLLEALERKY